MHQSNGALVSMQSLRLVGNCALWRSAPRPELDGKLTASPLRNAIHALQPWLQAFSRGIFTLRSSRQIVSFLRQVKEYVRYIPTTSILKFFPLKNSNASCISFSKPLAQASQQQPTATRWTQQPASAPTFHCKDLRHPLQ